MNTEPSDRLGKLPEVEELDLDRETFGRHVSALVRGSARPLETLANLIYLAKTHPDNAAKVVEYMTAAESEMTQITGLFYVLRMQIDWSARMHESCQTHDVGA